jgi:hypothetical protein
VVKKALSGPYACGSKFVTRFNHQQSPKIQHNLRGEGGSPGALTWMSVGCLVTGLYKLCAVAKFLKQFFKVKFEIRNVD